MSTEENKEKVRHYLEEAWNKGNADVADELYAPDVKDHSPYAEFRSPDEEKRYIAGVKKILPDFHTTIDDMIADGDKVVVRGHDTFTHNHEFLGNLPTGKKVNISWITIYRFENGKVVEKWIEQDMKGLIEQLGAHCKVTAA